MDLVHGVDVSYWEPRVDWNILRSQGFKFAFIRATSGPGYVDSKFKQFWEGARLAGILRGAYHYLMASQDPIKQADLFISTVGADKGELPPVVDLEDKYNENAINNKMIDTCKKVLDRIEQAFGRKPIIYSRTQFLKTRVSINGIPPAWAMDYPLWLAQYPYDPTTQPNGNMPTPAVGWQNWKFWQYSEKAVINGVTNEYGGPTACDLNWFRGTEAELYAFANITPKVPINHTVRNGETLQSLSDQYHITIHELLNANPNLLLPGAILKIPVTTIQPPAAVSTPPRIKIHYVVAGEYLSTIASKYGVTLQAILANNPLIVDANLIHPGDAIIIPG